MAVLKILLLFTKILNVCTTLKRHFLNTSSRFPHHRRTIIGLNWLSVVRMSPIFIIPAPQRTFAVCGSYIFLLLI